MKKKELLKTSMTSDEQKLFEQFSNQAKRHLKTMSKNDLVKTCVALLIDNYGLKGALEQFQEARNRVQEEVKNEDK
jgi:hypothetical protein